MRSLAMTIIILLLGIVCYPQQYNKDYEFMWLKPQKTNIKTLKKTENDKLLLLQEFDKNGNCYFIKNDSLNGDVTAIWGIECDEKGREVKTIFAHSNVGFYIYETMYSANIIKQYTYTTDTLEADDSNDNDTVDAVEDFQYNAYNFIKQIRSKLELEKLQNIIDVYKQKRYLEKITILNDQQKPITEYYLDYKSDTISYSKFTYTDDTVINEVRYKNNRIPDSFTDQLYFDSHKNLVKSFRIFYSNNDQVDTSAFTINTYNMNNKIVSTNTYEQGGSSTINYDYANGKLIFEKYTNESPGARYFTYKYNKKEELIEERIFDKLGSKKTLIHKYKTTYEYW